MLRPPSTYPPRVGLRIGTRTLPAIPLFLSGDQACLVFARAIPLEEEGALLLDWADGRTTELSVEVREIEEDGRVAHLDVHRVAGAWQPFLHYLGEQREAGAA